MGATRGMGVVARCWALLAAVTLTVATLAAPPPAQAAQAEPGFQRELVDALKSYLSDKQGRYSVSVTELDGEQRYMSLYGGRRLEPASTIKLFYAWAALRAVDAGTLNMTTRLSSDVTVQRCLTVMIQLSDNPCSVDLRLRLGMKTLNRLFASEGYPDTYIVLDSKGRYVTKRTSTDDLALLLTRLEQGVLLSEEGTNEFRKRLLAQVWRQRISSGVADGTVVGSKSGQLWVSTGMVEADTAIVYGPQSTYVLTVIGTHNAKGVVVRGISSMVYRYLQGDFTDRASFPATQMVTTATVTLRKVPGGSRIKTLPKGTAVQVLSSVRNWVRVKAAGKVGWVPFADLALHPAYRWPTTDVPEDGPELGLGITQEG